MNARIDLPPWLTGTTSADGVQAHIDHGWSLVPIPPSTKGPAHKGWNERTAALKAAVDLPPGWGIGLAHAYSGTCALDIDDMEAAKPMLAERGIDLQALLDAPDAVQIVSGREGRAKLLYRIPAPLPTKKISKDRATIFELRCSTSDGLTVHDCLPPSVHPDTQQPYRWAGAGHWSRLPVIPQALLDLWQSLLMTKNGITSTESTDATWTEITEALSHVKPDCSRQDWITVGMGLHSHGAQCNQIDQAFTVWDTWSAMGAKYPGPRAMAQQWHSFRDDKATAVTMGSVFKLARDAGWTRPQVDVSGSFSSTGEGDTDAIEVNLTDFFAYMPTHQYIYAPTRDLWPAASVDGRMAWPTVNGKKMRPSAWLDQHQSVEQMVWDPNEDALIKGRVMQVSGYAKHEGATIFNLYRPPEFKSGDSSQVGPWIGHLHRIYPEDADHLANYLAFKVQHPGVKINHALVLGGGMGIGKDTLLEPIKTGVGPWNWQEISPGAMLGRFNGWAKTAMLRINEARDLGEVDRFAFYDHSKTFLAAPPDVIRVDEKNLREHYVANVCGVVITTNHKTDGLYLPADDRRHYVAWSTAKREEFVPEYWNDLYRWYTNGGIENVVAYLLRKDLAQFDPKAPPTKTAAFWAVVQAGEAPESGELRDVIDKMGSPPAFTLARLAQAATTMNMQDLATELRDRKGRRAIPHKLERVGFVPVRNPDATDGLFVVAGNRVTVYADQKLPLAEQIRAARAIS